MAGLSRDRPTIIPRTPPRSSPPRLDMSVDQANQAGGTTTVSIAQASRQWGVRVVDLDGGRAAAPAPLAGPDGAGVSAHPAGAQYPAVYRFDVGHILVPNPYADQIVISPCWYRVRSTGRRGPIWAGWCRRWHRRSCPPPGSSGEDGRLEVGPATFWWENPTGAPAYQPDPRQVRLDGPWSSVVNLANATATRR